MNALVLAALDGLELDPSTASVVTAARQLVAATDGRVHVLVIGSHAEAAATQAAGLEGVETVLWAAEARLDVVNVETLARQLSRCAPPYAWVLAGQQLLARAAMPRAAALRGAAYLSDIVEAGPHALVRPAYAGAVLTTVRPMAAQTFLTVRTSAFVAAVSVGAATQVLRIDAVAPDTRTQLVARDKASNERPDLGRARIVVAGGRGVGSEQNMAKVEQLADHLGAAVGASRAAVDAGFAPSTAQIGQTGKIIAPDIYVALGISGAIQHLAGIKDAKCIVAINKDADAPIFQIADYGVVGDLFDALPHLQAGLPAAAAAG